MLVWVFVILIIACAALVAYNRSREHIPVTSPEFKKFQLLYLVPYLLMTAADWMQGPYVYALYESYGYGIADIGLLFTAGFASSMIFGTFVGSLSDKYGRKFCCMIYVVFYIASCLTKHSPSFSILMLGRLLGGIATSILFSAFESWMISEHFSKGFSEDWLSYTFYLQVSGNSVVAILSGVVAGYAYTFFGAMTAPFDTAIIFLVIGGAMIQFLWTENYGNQTGDLTAGFSKGFQTIKTDPKVLCLGISQSFYESAMYIFVFMWTPTLDLSYTNLDHGMVFSCFMVAVMIGSNVYKLAGSFYPNEKLLVYLFALAALSFGIPVMTKEGPPVLFSFLLFEATVGAFWPCISTLKGVHIPEDVRSTVMNYFRVPTNFFVLAVLNQVKQLSKTLVFFICFVLIACSVGSAYYIHAQASIAHHKKETIVELEDEKVGQGNDFDDAPSQETYNS